MRAADLEIPLRPRLEGCKNNYRHIDASAGNKTISALLLQLGDFISDLDQVQKK